MSSVPASLEPAYACCLRLGQAHYENFPVASKLLPAPVRPHIAAVYAFARYADDFADEGERDPDERLRLLDDWLRRLHATTAGPALATEHDDRDLVFAALGHTIRACRLPVTLFEELLSAFRQDVTVHRYRTWDELMDYCRRSANPVGRLVLRIAGYSDPESERAADHVCSALQITNFLQDFGQDWRRGRLYVPAEIFEAYGARELDLGGENLPSPWREALTEVGRRTRDLFEAGRGVCDAVSGRLKLELRVTWLGGRRILDRLEQTGYDPVMNRPTLGPADYASILWGTLRWPANSR